MRKFFFLFLASLMAFACVNAPKPAQKAEQAPRICTAREAPPVFDQSGRAVAQPTAYWPKGQNITVGFVGGTESQKSFTRKGFENWAKKASIKWAFVPDEVAGDADIRVSFDEWDGSWSYVGSFSKKVVGASMNLGWINEDMAHGDYSTVEHEAGHALGLLHEHQNPDGGIKWNEPAVIAALSGPPNNWSVAQIRSNVLSVAPKSSQFTKFDPSSVMLYFFPASWTLDGKGTSQNCCISAVDSSFVAGIYGSFSPVVTEKKCLDFLGIFYDQNELAGLSSSVLARVARNYSIDPTKFKTRKKLAAEIWKRR